VKTHESTSRDFRNNGVMARMRGPGAIGLALTAYDIWRRLPPAQRRMLLSAGRKHGPRIAMAAAGAAKAKRAAKKKRP
jgi:hypothetical protein